MPQLKPTDASHQDVETDRIGQGLSLFAVAVNKRRQSPSSSLGGVFPPNLKGILFCLAYYPHYNSLGEFTQQWKQYPTPMKMAILRQTLH